MEFDWFRADSPGSPFPHAQDVGASVFIPQPPTESSGRAWFVGSDGSLWHFRVSGITQVSSPGNLTRVAVSPNGIIWCVDARGDLWGMQDNVWSKINVPGEKVKDVAVSADNTVWLVMVSTRYYTMLPGGQPTYHGVFITLEALAGVAGPNDEHPYGIAWGVSSVYGTSVLCHCVADGWSPTNIENVSDLSVGGSGLVWMVKSNGTIWTTRDGITQLRMGNRAGFTKVATHPRDLTWAISADGSTWVWREGIVSSSAASPPPPPPVPQPSSPPEQPPPLITVNTSGGGTGTKFRVSGSRFLRNAQVNIRASRIGEDQIHQFYWTTTSNSNGEVQFDIPLSCVSGIVISFSANDGRRNPTDHTDRLWSNTVQATCPPG